MVAFPLLKATSIFLAPVAATSASIPCSINDAPRAATCFSEKPATFPILPILLTKSVIAGALAPVLSPK